MAIDRDDDMTLRLREQDLDWRDLDDEIVALDAEAAVYLAVQGSGALLWRLLAASTTRNGMVESLVDTYELDAAGAGDDVDEFLAMLRERGLLSS
jgi:Coenzyme PQQ synthesis protein D (PqqD)